MVGDSGGWAVLPAASGHCSPGLGRPGAGASFGLSHRGGSGPGSRGAGSQFGNWKNLAASGSGDRGGSAYRGTGKLSGVLSPRFHREGHLPGLLRAAAPDTALPGHPLPPALRPRQGEGLRTRLPAGTCVGRREGAEWGGTARRRRAGFSCSQRETGGRRYYCSAGPGGPGTRGARPGL